VAPCSCTGTVLGMMVLFYGHGMICFYGYGTVYGACHGTVYGRFMGMIARALFNMNSDVGH
jgi:hypothetical protein